VSGDETANLPTPPTTGAEWLAGGRRIPYDPKSACVPTDEEATASTHQWHRDPSEGASMKFPLEMKEPV
jgi:hypothetical protein